MISRDSLMEKMWGYDFEGGTRTVDVRMGLLREKIESDPGKLRRILTVRGGGYKFEGQAFRSIRWPIAVPFIVLILASAAGIGLYLSHDMGDHDMDTLRSQLTDQARPVADASQPHFGEQQAELDALAAIRAWPLLQIEMQSVQSVSALTMMRWMAFMTRSIESCSRS